jgi:lipoate-protein ligase A
MATWRYLTDDGVGAAEGLALDEALMAGVGRRAGRPAEPTLRLYSYADHAALVGRYQTLDAELDLAECAATGTAVSRRPTGGGAIVMGSDQLGVALVLPAPATAPRALLRELGGGVVDGLAKLGVRAQFGGKNDLVVAGRKIAGLGLYRDGHGALLFHVSLLRDLDVEFMLRVLRIPAAKLAGAGVAAVRDRVTTVTRELGRPVDLSTLRTVVAEGFAERHGVVLRRSEADATEQAAARELVAGRYAHPSWLHERSAQPDGTGSAVFRSPEGLVRVFVAAQGPLVKSVMFTGDFNTVPSGLRRLESALRWRRLDEPTVAELVAGTRADRDPDLGDSDLGWRRDADVVAAVLGAGAKAVDRAAAQPVRAEGSCYFPDKPTGDVPAVRSPEPPRTVQRSCS